MNETDKRTLTKKRATLKASITRIQHFVNTELDSADVSLIQVKLNRLLSTNEEFKQVQSELELSDEDNAEGHAAYRQEFEDIVDRLEAKLRKATFAQNVHENDDVSIQSSRGRSTYVKLPKINLPSFSGGLTTWLHFKDTFEGLVVNNKELSNIEKFHYLLSSLRGEAKESIRNISVSEANFTVAYNILVNRYHSPKLIAAEYVRQIMEKPQKLCSSETEIRHLINTFQGSIDALNALDAQPSILDLLLNELLLSRLDKKLRLEFETQHAQLDAVGFKELISFLERRCQTLQLCSLNQPAASSQSHQSKPRLRIAPQQQTYISTSERCFVCSEQHKVYKCPDFLKLSCHERFKLIKDNKHCTNCLSSLHTWRECKSKTACKICNKYHHTLLHQEDENTSNTRQANDPTAQNSQGSNSRRSSYHSLKNVPNSQVLLSTALVKVKDSNGRYHRLRAVLDSGSQSNFISEQAVHLLKLKKRKTTTISLQSFGDLTSEADTSVNIDVHSTVSDFHFNMECIVLPRITGHIPTLNINYKDWNIPNDVILADPDFHISQSTHLLIGAQFFLQLMKERKKAREGYPTLQDTHLGWILSGEYPQQPIEAGDRERKSLFIRSELSLENQIQRFWALEEIDHITHSPEHKECEKHFKDTTVRDENGRYIVELPIKKEISLGNSKDMASKRFYFLEKKLQIQSKLRHDYVEFMKEYEALGHMVELQSDSARGEHENYMPHHAVHKHSSSTTKTRVVFDASARTENGVALNDILMVGPTVQDDLCSLVMRCRMHRIAFTADVEKMYRQVKVHPKHQQLQCILWRESPDEELKTYALTTVTYGTASASYLATRCLQQLATDEATRFPRATSVLRNDFYVDDCISGTETLEEALKLRVELQDLLQLGGFPLRKWCTNSPELLESIPENLREHKHSLTDDDSSLVKTLGLTWHPSSDVFQINCGLNSNDANKRSCSKRMVLSTISSIFDPLGLVTPVVILCKVFMQRLWQEGSGWDDQLLESLLEAWIDLYKQIPMLNDIKIPRFVLIEGNVNGIEIHGFCDASQTAYGTSIYVRSMNDKGEVLTRLLCAKSRVAPLKQISIPRLELCGALILARLVKKTLRTLRTNPDSVYLWTDSAIVLAWLRACPTKWKTFVANRVAEIQDIVPASHWRHVRSQDNPADLASRGVQPMLLKDCHLWWEGPSWLRLDPSSWPLQERYNASKIPDQRTVTSLIVMQHDDEFLDRFSSLNRLLRTIAYCLRFSSNCKKTRKDRDTSSLKPHEVNNAFNVCVKIVQSVSCQKEIQCITQGKPVDANSKLKSLSPILDQNGYLRVGGRLQNAPVAYEAKHQLILPPQHHFTKLVILREHLRLLHAGPQLLISSIRQKYWVPRIRQIVKKCTHSCLTCYKLKKAVAQQKMANLPRPRVTPSRPFTNVGVDYAGPFVIRIGNQRSRVTAKAYAGIFTCLATRAVHIEIISDLSTSAFVAALRRFTSRRGCPANIYSDNGTNFIGASRKLREIQIFLQEKEIIEAAGGLGIAWHFIPPSSPHFGGVWESMVKAFKYHLRRTMGSTILTFEELTTLASQIEACLNSRPLSRLSDDPTDSSYLTPSHFLVGEPLTALPDYDLKDCPVSSLSRWKHIQKMTQDFWKIWHTDYLNTLQQRHKWSEEHPNLRPGDLVIIKEDNLPPLQWRRGVIDSVHLGDDGLARVARVKTGTGSIMRPIKKLCVLPEFQ